MASDIPSITPGGTEQNNQLRFIIDVLLRHWGKALIATVLMGLLGGVAASYTKVEEHTFFATTDLTIKASLYDSPVMQDLGGTTFGQMTPENVVGRYTTNRVLAEEIAVALVQQDISESRALANLSTQDEMLSRALDVESRLTFTPYAVENKIEITAIGGTYKEAERLADTAARILIDQSKRSIARDQQRTYDVVRIRIDELSADMSEADEVLMSYREQPGFMTRTEWMEELSANRAELRDKEAANEALAREIEAIDLQLAENLAELPGSLGEISQSTVEKLQTQLDSTLVERAQIQVHWSEGAINSPVNPLGAKNEQVETQTQAILKAVDQMNANGGSGGLDQRFGLLRERETLQSNFRSNVRRISTLRTLLDAERNQDPEMLALSLEFEKLERESEEKRTQFSDMLSRELRVKFAMDQQSATLARRGAVVVVDQPTRSGQSTTALTLLGGLIGFVAVFAYAMMSEGMNTSIRHADDVTSYLGLEVLGTIPQMRFTRRGRGKGRKGTYVISTGEEAVERSIVTQYDPKSPVSEAYRSLRTNFQFATIQEKPKTVMFTSAVPAEGKTTSAVNFAVTMADRGLRVLVVDTDLRRPNVHRFLKMERGPGLADVLRERIPVKNVIRSTRVDRLSIISSGRVPPNPSELIGSDRMKKLMDELESMFDLVVCDAPSLHVVTDPVLLATHVDSVLLVVSVNHARRETILRAKKFLVTANPRIAGVVLNGLEATRRHYYYYYYYYDDKSKQARRGWFANS